jgi:hypothetical protein
LMMGVPVSTGPLAPTLVSVIVPPVMSVGESDPARARAAFAQLLGVPVGDS